MNRLPGARRRTAAMRIGAALVLAIGLGIARAPSGAAPAPPSIQIEDFRFEPAELVVAAGSTVSWVNRDQELHAVVAADGTFSSPGLDTDGRYDHTFEAAGTYEYRCALHPHMTGRIVVR